MDKKKLTEADIRTKFITPAISNANWDIQLQIREEVYFTKGKVTVRGKTIKRGDSKKADYILYYKPNIPIAIVEAKDNNHSIGDGMQQALDYAEILDIPFAYSSNGDGFLEHDRTGIASQVEKELALSQFPSPDELWRRYVKWKGLNDQENSIITQDYYSNAGDKTPRYYQLIAINRTMEAIAKGQDRILLVMATGTGKTYTAFQIIWRLWKAKIKRRILFLADRNILVDQTKINDFKPFGQAMTKIRNRKVDKSYEIYLSLYQAVTGSEEEKNIFKDFSRDFFDLIVIDECHRGSAAEDSAWREILEYFDSATQIGMTATPKETKYVSNIHYFGKPIYTYSLKQGIEDGFLAPYKVIRIDLDKDITGWRPESGKKDSLGYEIEDRIYNQRDFDRNLILTKRTKLVAKKVSEYLKSTNRYDKTIVFCEDIDHAERMRYALTNENGDIAADNRKYIMRITGDNDEGKMELDNFIDPESRFPVIATTSKLMSTGVDAQTCKLIVLDKNIRSMTEFKQIIGRGTRINEEFDKYYFTIIDFKKATELFADPDFDGEPVQIYEPKGDEPIVPPDDIDDGDSTEPEDMPEDGTTITLPPDILIVDGPEEVRPKKYIVNDVEVAVSSERVQYIGEDGRLITESLKDYTRKRFLNLYDSLDTFLQKWTDADKKQAIIEELEKQGIFFENLEEEIGKDFDPFDMICHVVFGQPPLTRKERANNVRKRDYFTKYGDKAQLVLNALLDKYAEEGITNIESLNVLKVKPVSDLGTPIEIIDYFGGKEKYLDAIYELEKHLYNVA